MVDPISDALVSIKNSGQAAKTACEIRPASKLLGKILHVLQQHEYISTFELVDDGREGIYRIQLVGKINDVKAIKPRYAVKKGEFEKYEKRYLPSKDIGLLIVSTSKGVLTHKAAKSENIGGRLIAFVY